MVFWQWSEREAGRARDDGRSQMPGQRKESGGGHQQCASAVRGVILVTLQRHRRGGTRWDQERKQSRKQGWEETHWRWGGRRFRSTWGTTVSFGAPLSPQPLLPRCTVQRSKEDFGTRYNQVPYLSSLTQNGRVASPRQGST